MTQLKCAVDGCLGTAIPGRSPHGKCLQHEKKHDNTICPVDGCENKLNPETDKAGLCQDCQIFLRRMYWMLNRVKIQESGGKKPQNKVITPGEFYRETGRNIK